MQKTKRLILVTALTLGLTAVFSLYSYAGPLPLRPLSGDPVSIKTHVSLTSVPMGGNFKIALELNIDDQWHINANKVNDPYLIPTSVSIDPPDGISILEIIYPAGIEKTLTFSDTPLRLYGHRAIIGILAGISKDFAEGDTVLTATVTYQACDNTRCLPPVDKAVTVPLKISSRFAAVDEVNPELFAPLKFEAENVQIPPDPTSLHSAAAEKNEGNRLQRLLESRGMLFVFLMVFLGGLALNLTPCVYPIIPITVSYFGGQSKGKSSRTLMLALLYVVGMAVMYSSLGLAASLTGGILGNALQNPIVLAFVALVLVLLAFSMFGLYEIRLPAALSNVAGTAKRGAPGAFFMGLTVGIVAAPCIGPFVLGLLTFVGESGNPVLGFFMFFTLAVGLGLPFIALAMLSGSISRLPKSGEWMEWVRKLFGVILVAMAVYFLEPVLGNVFYFLLLGLLFITSGLLLGFALKSSTQALFFLVFRRFVGIAAPLLGLYLILAPGHIIARNEGGGGGIPWQVFNTKLIEKAKKGGEPVMIDFFADWCIPCKELDSRTFSHPSVIKEAQGVLALKADLTHSSSPEVNRLRKAFLIKGVPTVVFLDRNGHERRDLRILGFVNQIELVERLEKLKSGGSG